MEKHNSVIMSTIEKGSLVLVTGASGYIASQTCNQFLEAGYRVRGTVRGDEKAKWLYEIFDAKFGKGKFEHAVVPDMMAEGAFDEAVKGVSGVCHMANVMTFSDKYDDVVPPVVRPTRYNEHVRLLTNFEIGQRCFERPDSRDQRSKHTRIRLHFEQHCSTHAPAGQGHQSRQRNLG